MILPLALIRPAPGWQASAATAGNLGLAVIGEPLFAVSSIEWDLPNPAAVDAVLLASANALRHGGAALAALAGKPAYAVGEATASAARGAGFDVIAVGHDDLQALAARILPEHRRLLRLSGQDRGAFEPPAGVSVVERVVYTSHGLPMSPAFAAALAAPAVIALHSPRAARFFGAECHRLDIDPGLQALAALSPRVAEAGGLGWRDLRAAPHPTDSALLALAAEMCKTAPAITKKPQKP